MSGQADLRGQIASMIAVLPEDAPVVLPKAWVQRLLEAAHGAATGPDYADARELAVMIGLVPRWLLFDVRAARRWMQTRPRP